MRRLRFPTESVECKAGDYLLSEAGPGRWIVHRVVDIVMFSRMIPMKFTAGVELMEEEHLLDSRAPAYSGELFLLLEVFDTQFPTQAQAATSAGSNALGASRQGTFANIKRFARGRTVVVPVATE